MPDFSTDRIVTFTSQKQLLDALSEKSKHGGGALRGISSTDVKGGNAINIAYCLAKLGAKVKLFTIADGIGSSDETDDAGADEGESSTNDGTSSEDEDESKE
jgi:ribokinase